MKWYAHFPFAKVKMKSIVKFFQKRFTLSTFKSSNKLGNKQTDHLDVLPPFALKQRNFFRDKALYQKLGK